jgi:hypothetical protein
MLRGDHTRAPCTTEANLIHNAKALTLMFLSEYRKAGRKWHEENLIEAVCFASFYLLSPREKLTAEDRPMLDAYMRTL